MTARTLPLATLTIGVAGCTQEVALYCDENTPCEDPQYPFCDVYGEYPASEGIAKTCIGSPFDAGPTDAAVGSVSVSLGGTGNGSVVSSPFGINCGTTCEASFTPSTTITLTATPESDSVFSGWSGAGCSGTGTCEFVFDGSGVNVTASFALKEYDLVVSTGGDGAGGVASTEAGIDCGSDCTETYTHGSAVTLTATSTGQSGFGGWAGDCSGLTPTCALTMDSAKNVTASFDLDGFTLSVSLAGTGGGSVTSNSGTIDCPSGDCADSYSAGTTVTLTASSDATSTFTGWTGDCTGTPCQVTMTAARSVTATFTRITHTLTVAKSSTRGGDGLVTSNPSGISCGTDCTEIYDKNTPVSLSQAPIGNAIFMGWSVSGCGVGDPTCDVTMETDVTVTASYCAPLACGALQCGDVDDGCGGTMSCPECCNSSTHECVVEPEPPWLGPVIRYEAPNGNPTPACTSEYATLLGDYGFDFSAGGSCDCDCLVNGLTCGSSITLTEYTGFGCTIAEGTQTLTYNVCANAHSDMDDRGYYMFPAPTLTGSCTPQILNNLVAAAHSDDSRVCSGATYGGICASSGEVCAPKASGLYDTKLCMYYEGQASCPAGSPYTEQYLRYENVTDSRSCGGCSCGGLLGSCGYVGILSAVPCGQGGGGSFGNVNPGTCGGMGSTPATGFTWRGMTGDCAESNGVVSGSASETGPITLCCLP